MYIHRYVCMYGVYVCMYVFDKFHTAPAEEILSYPFYLTFFLQNIGFQSVLCKF
jgi:hypothetical protein